MNQASLFHPGELAVQTRANEADIAQRNAAVVSKHIIKGALPFIAQQFMAVISSSDENNRIWTSVLLGKPGFITAPDDRHVLINPQQIIEQAEDPLWRNIAQNSRVGLLIIELSSRRRLRVNGNICLLANGQYQVTVAQAYPNCPKYIQRRQVALSAEALSYNTPTPCTGQVLTAGQLELIARSDSFFVGSGVPEQHYDVSYRGGAPGFVTAVSAQQLLIPDYKGNSMFNTLGNFELNPHAGLVFIDFESNILLQLTGTAKVLWDQKDEHNTSGGSKRFWRFTIASWRETQLPPGLHWTFFDYSPHNPKPQGSENLALVVADIEQISQRVKLFRLSAEAGAILPAFEPGAHLPVEVELGQSKKALRHYSIISSSHDNRFYEIAVQQEKHGAGGSNYLHEKLRIGQILNVRAPVNEFSLLSAGKHHILIAGGIGITPVLSMLRQLADSQASFELHYSAKTENDLVFKKEIFALAGDRAHFYCTRETGGNRLDLHALFAGSNKASHVYICGPVGMIEAVKNSAGANGWQASHIHYESFGGAIQETDTEVEVKLQKTGQVIVIDPKETLLDGLLAADVQVPFECRRGECGMCVTEYVAGTPDHRDVYLTKEEKNHSLCLCVSRAKTKFLTLDL